METFLTPEESEFNSLYIAVKVRLYVNDYCRDLQLIQRDISTVSLQLKCLDVVSAFTHQWMRAGRGFLGSGNAHCRWWWPGRPATRSSFLEKRMRRRWPSHSQSPERRSTASPWCHEQSRVQLTEVDRRVVVRKEVLWTQDKPLLWYRVIIILCIFIPVLIVEIKQNKSKNDVWVMF